MATDAANGWLTPKQVAFMAGITPACLAKWRMQGLPPTFHRMGGKILYRRDDINLWLASTRNEPA